MMKRPKIRVNMSTESGESSQQPMIHEDENDMQSGIVDGVEQIDIENSNGDGNSAQQLSKESDNGSQSVDDYVLPKRRILAYSIGHFYNDLCASMWFTYLLIYLEKVVLMRSWQAGLLMLIGQITDAISTPFVGILSDLAFLPNILKKFGRRKPWHFMGTLCVTFSFPLIFSGCLICNISPWFHLFWFIPPIMLFQFGWACVQISHLAMIPELTRSEHVRLSMTSFRYGFTVMANLFVFACLFLFLAKDGQTTISPIDLSNFRNLGIIAVGLGIVVTILFYAGVSEPPSGGQRRMSLFNSENGPQQLPVVKMAWHSWFRYQHFYQVGALYVLSRIYINVSQIYLSFYITQTRQQAKQFVALLPLTAYLTSMLASLLLGIEPISRRAGGKPLFFGGALVGVLNCIALYHPPLWPNPLLVLFGVVALLGLIQAVLLISSLNATATLINRNTESGAFVYGSMSFLDKLCNGVIVQLLELLNPSCHQSSTPSPSHHIACANFYRDVMSWVPGGCAIGIVVVLLGTNVKRIGTRRTRDEEQRQLIAEEGEEN